VCVYVWEAGDLQAAGTLTHIKLFFVYAVAEASKSTILDS